jgi:hypothetical protein
MQTQIPWEWLIEPLRPYRLALVADADRLRGMPEECERRLPQKTAREKLRLPLGNRFRQQFRHRHVQPVEQGRPIEWQMILHLERDDVFRSCIEKNRTREETPGSPDGGGDMLVHGGRLQA